MLFILALFSCRDQNPPPLPGIEGAWRQLIPVHPPTQYVFHDGVMTQTVFVGADPVAEIQRTYAERGDTLLIGGDVGDPARRWLLRYIGDGALEATTIGAGPTGLGVYYIFERQ